MALQTAGAPSRLERILALRAGRSGRTRARFRGQRRLGRAGARGPRARPVHAARSRVRARGWSRPRRNPRRLRPTSRHRERLARASAGVARCAGRNLRRGQPARRGAEGAAPGGACLPGRGAATKRRSRSARRGETISSRRSPRSNGQAGRPTRDRRRAYARRHHHHLQLRREGQPPLELHFRARVAFGTVMPAADLIARSSAVTLTHGRGLRILAPEDELVYLAVHAAAHAFIRLMWLYDLKLLCRRYASEIDWRAVVERARSVRVLTAVAFTCEMLRERLNVAVPDLPELLRHAGCVIAIASRSSNASRAMRACWRSIARAAWRSRRCLCDRPLAARARLGSSRVAHVEASRAAAPAATGPGRLGRLTGVGIDFNFCHSLATGRN